MQTQREVASQKLRDAHDRKIYHWIGWAETFEARAGSDWKPTDENEYRTSPIVPSLEVLIGVAVSSSMEDLWMNLVDETISLSQIKRDLTTDRAGWLAYHARRDIEKASESLSEEIGKELDVRPLLSSTDIWLRYRNRRRTSHPATHGASESSS